MTESEWHGAAVERLREAQDTASPERGADPWPAWKIREWAEWMRAYDTARVAADEARS